jgi:hypothetical protein
MNIVAFLFFIAVASFAVSRALEQARTRILRATLTLAFTALVLLEFAPASSRERHRWNPGGRVPPVYRWLRDQPGRDPGIELPVGGWGDFAAMYWQAYHGKPIANCWGGFVGELGYWIRAHESAAGLPRMLEVLRAFGVRWATVRHDAPQHLAQVRRLPYARPAYNAGGVTVFRLDPIGRLGEASVRLRIGVKGIEVVVHNPSPNPAVALPSRAFDLSWELRCGDESQTRQRRVVFEPFWAASGETRSRLIPWISGLSGRCAASARIAEGSRALAEAAGTVVLGAKR